MHGQRLGLLRGVRMGSIRVDLELLDHGVAERTFGQHALDRFLERAARNTFLHFGKIGFVNAAGIARVTVILFIQRFVAGNAQLGGVDDHDKVAGIHMWSELRLVFATQPARHFGGDMAEHLIVGVNNEPVVFDFLRFGGKGFHRDLYVRPILDWRKPVKCA